MASAGPPTPQGIPELWVRGSGSTFSDAFSISILVGWDTEILTHFGTRTEIKGSLGNPWLRVCLGIVDREGHFQTVIAEAPVGFMGCHLVGVLMPLRIDPTPV